MKTTEKRIANYREFWKYYLTQHRDPTCRLLHFSGTTLVFFLLMMSVVFSRRFLYVVPLGGYGCAWAGHLFYEKNRPATFQYPFWSLMADIKMWWRMLIGNSLT